LKPSSLSLPVAATAVLTAAIFAVATIAQAAQSSQPAAGGQAHEEHEHAHPAPTNLKVLPKDMTGEQVHELMHHWEAELGTTCGTCHAADPKNIGPNGRPRLNFADDSKPEKATARLMYRMTEDINKDYVGKIDTSGEPVTCGTCHRGHLGPLPFILPPDDDHDHDHDGPHPGATPSKQK
jgi:hypothetical protein